MEKQKIQKLIVKYNDVLLESMKNAIAEDLFNLIVVNSDDTEGELRDLIKSKSHFKDTVMKEFLKYNSSAVTKELKEMKEKKMWKKKPNAND